MQKTLILAAVVLAALALAGVVYAADSAYIYAIHDAGGEQNMADMGTKGWIVFTEEIGYDPNNYTGRDYQQWSNAGYGVIVRLNNGYGSAGTIPNDSQYDNFAARCANYVANSPGVDYWIIGNETNLPREWPGNVNGDPNTGQPITVSRYVSCYNKCYTAIKAVRSTAKICPSPSGTWAPPYTAQGVEGFLDYWVNCLNGIGATKIDGLPIHTYTHGCDPALITSEQKMGPPYTTIYYHFRAYKNFMNAVPTAMRTKPVFITETGENIECADGGATPRHTWYNSNNGWVRAAYAEINSWNSANSQKIRCLALFRWWDVAEGEWNFGIQYRQGVIDDWRQAMTYQYRWTTSQNDANSGTDAGNTTGTALTISPGTYTGYLASGTDTNDYYKFSVTSGQLITCSMTPPAGMDFDIYLYNPSGTLKASSLTRGSGAESINFTADATGNWYFRVYCYSGTGIYTFSVGSTGGMNNNTPTGTNMAPQSTQVSTDTNYGTDWTGAKAIDGVCTSGSKWVSTGSVATHWLALDLGASRTVNGFIVRHAGAGGEQTYYNTQAFKIQSASSMSGPWSDECTVDNTAQANVTTRSYNTPKSLRYVRLYITDPGVDNYARIPEFEVWCAGGVTGELLTNPGFEGGFTSGIPNGWTTWTGGWSNPVTFMDEVNTIKSGSHSARWGRNDNLRVHGGPVQRVNVTSGVSYDITGWVRFVSSDPGSWMEVGYDLTGQTTNGEAATVTYTKLESGGQNTWLYYSRNVTATGSTLSVFLKFGHYDEVGSGYCWAVADDMSVKQH